VQIVQARRKVQTGDGLFASVTIVDSIALKVEDNFPFGECDLTPHRKRLAVFGFLMLLPLVLRVVLHVVLVHI
jgi:hypothetical protein